MAAADMLDAALDRPDVAVEREPQPDTRIFTFEHVLGSAATRGEIDAEEAIRALDDFEAWLNAGEPKVTTLPGYWIFK